MKLKFVHYCINIYGFKQNSSLKLVVFRIVVSKYFYIKKGSSMEKIILFFAYLYNNRYGHF